MHTNAPASRHNQWRSAVSAAFTTSKPKMSSVTAGVGYLKPMTERPFNYLCPPPDGSPWQNCEYDTDPVQIVDARAIGIPPHIDSEGFELWDAPTSLASFYDEEAVTSRYYPEVAELAKRVTGAEQAYVFDHQLRRREAGRPTLNFGRQGGGSRPGAAGRIHNDYTEASGARRFELAVPDPGVRSRVKRFAIVNIWRSIAGKIVDTPLALCDARTVSAADLVSADTYYTSRRGEIYLLRRSPRHVWAYFSEMDRHEALVFKQYDSQVRGVARFTPHSAFDLPDVPADAPLRESIEIRCLVTYS